LVYAHPDLRKWCEQYSRIEIALHSRAVADVHPSLVDIDAPIDAHHIAARCVQFAEESRTAGSKVNDRHACRPHTLNQGARIRGYESHVIVRTERAYPAIENLD